MKFYDFEYDGIRLSDMGFMTCTFDKESDVVTPSSTIELTMVSFNNGTDNIVVKVKHNSNVEFTFQICNTNFCNDGDSFVSSYDVSKIFQWLNRKKVLKFKPIDDNGLFTNVYFTGTFNVSTIEFGGNIIGFELSFISNKPYALTDVYVRESGEAKNWTFTIEDISEDDGILYPEVKIEITKKGDLSIKNSRAKGLCNISGCVEGEKINISYPIITSTEENISERFNWNFPMIYNDFRNKRNEFEVSLPCNIEMHYSPAIKMTL